MNLEFKTRKTYVKKQIGLICNPETFKEFKAEVEKNDLKMCDVFDDFMVWFTKESKAGRIK